MSASESLAFVDTNIFLYAYSQQSAIKGAIAQALLDILWKEKRGCLSVQVLQEFASASLKKITLQETAILEEVLHDLGQWTVHTPGASDVLAAVRIRNRYRISFWDAMALHSASSLGCEVFYSEDLNAGQMIDGLRIVNPFA